MAHRTREKTRQNKNRTIVILLLLAAVVALTALGLYRNGNLTLDNLLVELGFKEPPTVTVSMDDIPPYSGDPYVVLQDNWPNFGPGDLTTEAFEIYSELDGLGRCGPAYANICLEIMPEEPRGDIGAVKPSGWQAVKYDFIEGKYLYNRCHLIGYQLAGENANKQNLITGTRYLNVTGMLPFENMVDSYVENTENHVLYRVTPVFEENNLVASGVQMEAFSVEDEGEGICFHVFVYNVQPGVRIDYATGNSWKEP